MLLEHSPIDRSQCKCGEKEKRIVLVGLREAEDKEEYTENHLPLRLNRDTLGEKKEGNQSEWSKGGGRGRGDARKGLKRGGRVNWEKKTTRVPGGDRYRKAAKCAKSGVWQKQNNEEKSGTQNEKLLAIASTKVHRRKATASRRGKRQNKKKRKKNRGGERCV